MAAMNTSIRMVNRCSTVAEMKAVEYTSDRVTSDATRIAAPAPVASTLKLMPRATPWRGSHPANQYTIGPCTVLVNKRTHDPVAATEVAIPVHSTTQRGSEEANAAMPAATSS